MPAAPGEAGLEEPQIPELAQLVAHGPIAVGDQPGGARM